MLFSLFLTSPVLAGGPASSQTTNIRKRQNQNIESGYIAISAKVDGIQYCLRNYGAMIAGISTCGNLDEDNTMSLFRYSRAFPSATTGTNRYKYLLRSAYNDNLCLDLNDNNDLGYLNMVPCSKKPWVFNWNSTASPLVAPEANPTFKIITSPKAGFKEDGFSRSNCFTPDGRGGLDLEKCANTQKFTWFVYRYATLPPKQSIHTNNLKGAPTNCDSLSSSIGDSSYGCESVPEDSTIIRSIHDDGVLAYNIKNITGLGFTPSVRIYFKLQPNNFGDDSSLDYNLFKFTSGLKRFEVSMRGSKLHFEGLGIDAIHNYVFEEGKRYNVKFYLYRRIVNSVERYYLKIITYRGDTIKSTTYSPTTLAQIDYDDVKYSFASPSGTQIADASLSQINIKYLTKYPLEQDMD